MAAKLYYVNHKGKTALFYGEYNSEPDVPAHPDLKAWLDTFGPAVSHFIRPDVPAMYPWSNGTGRVDERWKLWLMYPGRHQMKPSGPWRAWPAPELEVLGVVGHSLTASTGNKVLNRPKAKH